MRKRSEERLSLFQPPPRRWLARSRVSLMIFAALGQAVIADAQEAGSDSSPHSDVALVSEVASIQPGRVFTVALRITLDPGWHTYWINAGDAGLPLEIRWHLPAGFAAASLEWPVPSRIPVMPFMSYGYENEVLVLARITPPALLPPQRPVTLSMDADWLVCADVCIPENGEASLTLPMTSDRPVADSQWASVIVAARERLPQPSAGWRTRVWAVDSAYVLEVIPEAGTSLEAPYLFVDSVGIIEHARPQHVVRIGDRWRIRIPKSEYAPENVTRLSGVLVADARAGHDSSAWTIDATIGAVPADVAAESSDAFLAGSVQETGGMVAATVSEQAGGAGGPGIGVLIALGFGFLGGLILNLMPCVFPVLTLKVMSFVQNAGADRRKARRHAYLFTTGVVISFWALAGALFTLRSAGAQLGWGFHLQSPAVVAFLALGIFALALSMSGVFEIGLVLTRLGRTTSSRSDVDALLTGGLAVLVAAPCTAPFMGAALGYALVQPPVAGFAVFTALALGLAAPYSIFAATPSLLGRLPRPGRWMETLKQALAFPLYATVVWLVWVFGRQAGLNASAVLLLGLTLAGFAAWLVGRTGGGRTSGVRVAVAVVVLTSLATSLWGARAVPESRAPETATASAMAGDAVWVSFSPQRVTALRNDGRTVFVNVTAAWCLSCQVNDRFALRSASVRSAFAAANVALLEADFTTRDAAIAEALQSFGRSGVPLYIVFPPDKASAPEVLPAILTPGIVTAAIERAESVRTAGS